MLSSLQLGSYVITRRRLYVEYTGSLVHSYPDTQTPVPRPYYINPFRCGYFNAILFQFQSDPVIYTPYITFRM